MSYINYILLLFIFFTSYTSYADQNTIQLLLPQNINIKNNRTATDTIMITWDKVYRAKSYNIYQMTLSNCTYNSNNLQKD